MMKIYPSNADNSSIMTFRDNNKNIKYYVAKQSDFKNKVEFISYLVGKNIPVSNIVEELYIRYYSVIPKKKDCLYAISDTECYAFANKGRGAIKVFAIKRRVLDYD